MDPSDPNQIPDDGGGGGGEEERRALRIFTRCGCGIILSLGLSFFFSVVFVFVAIGIGNLTAKPPVSVPAICRIVSSSVDIRSSKVCELGLLNYRAKNVLYPLGKGKKRYRCHDDYYWASVFEVEYKEYFSGQVLQAVAEAPKEALPHDCRPSFGTAWSTKMKFKVSSLLYYVNRSSVAIGLAFLSYGSCVIDIAVLMARHWFLECKDASVNETYNCRYTLGSHKADICPDNLFNCQSKDPSVTELVRRFFILFMRSVIFDKDSTRLKGVYAVAGTISGMLFGICFVILVKTLQFSVPALIKRWKARKHQLQSFAIGLRRACLLVAYFCAAAWLMLEYGKMIGLKTVFFEV